jgi:exosortase/archaeosortase family protein
MATWFFAELQRLRPPGALTLLGIACSVAFVVNTARAYALASIRFNHGESAFNQAHDWLGLLAFALSAVVFYLVSGLLSGHPRRVLVKSRHGRPAARFTHDP